MISSGSARRDVLVAALLALALVGSSVACAESPTESDAYRSLAEQASSLRATVEAKTEELRTAVSNDKAATTVINNWKKSSNTYRTFLRGELRIAGNLSCAETIVKNLSGQLGFTELRVEDIFNSKPQLSDALLRSDAQLLGVATPDGCPSWWIWDDVSFMSGEDLEETLCSEIDLGKISKAPTRYQGECFRGTAEIVQWDINTGECAFHATIGRLAGQDVRAEFEDPSPPCDWLEEYAQGDRIGWHATANGVLTYDTIQGDTMSIPTFRIFSIGHR